MSIATTQFPGTRSVVAGFSYTEVMVAVFLIAIVLVPAIDALQGGVEGGAVHSQINTQQSRLSSLMEQVLARPFNELESAADTAAGPTVVVDSLSDTPGTPDRRLVFLARYDGDDADGDGDPFTGFDPDLVWVRVAIADSPRELHGLVSNR